MRKDVKARIWLAIILAALFATLQTMTGCSTYKPKRFDCVEVVKGFYRSETGVLVDEFRTFIGTSYYIKLKSGETIRVVLGQIELDNVGSCDWYYIK